MANKLRSDAALKRANQMEDLNGSVVGEQGNWTMLLWDPATGHDIAEISLKEVINKRASLAGVEAKMRKALRPSKKKAAKKR